jgi:predicted dehydrogenase
MAARRVGIVGVGWGALVQVPAFAALPEFEVAALCGRRLYRLQKAGADAGIEDLSTDWESFVRRPDLDVISVATPVEMHHEIALAAISAGKHVLCEKPLSLRAVDAARMADAAEAAGVANAVAFQLRWLPDRMAILHSVRDGTVGDPYFLRISQANGYWHPTHRAQESWMYDLAAGGGYLNGVMAHDIDFVQALTGPPTAARAEIRHTRDRVTLEDGREVVVTADDTDVVMLRLATGGIGILTFCAVGRQAGGFSFEMYGSTGSITADTRGTSRTRGDREDQMWRTDPAAEGWVALSPSERRPRTDSALPEGRFSSRAIRALAMFLEDWLPAFDGQSSRVPGFRDGWRVQALIEAARRSHTDGGWVELAD